MKCKEIQEKEKINLKLQNKKKVQKLKEKGITLIALVVTIIILLILAGVTLNMALSGDGLFNMARKAATDYNQKSVEEKLQILYAEKIMEDNDSNTEVKTDVTDVLEEMVGGEITEENIEEFNKLLEKYNEEVKGIKTAEDLALIGKDDNHPIDGVYVQLSNIDNLTTQIGSKDKPFKGIYNGNGKRIKNLNLTSEEDYTGMFRANEGTVKNITIEACQITSNAGYVGGVVGRNVGLIENCSVSDGEISGVKAIIGGICGLNTENGVIRDCQNSAEVDGSNKLVGGICGYNYNGTIRTCSNKNSVTGQFQVGGITGNVNGDNEVRAMVIDCRNYGEVGVTSDEGEHNCVGGIAGFEDHNSIMEGCKNVGNVDGFDLQVGGIVGIMNHGCEMRNCINEGIVKR